MKKKIINSTAYIGGKKFSTKQILTGRTLKAVNLQDPAKLKIVAIDEKKKIIILYYLNRFISNDPLVNRHRVNTFSFDQFVKTHWHAEA